MRTMTKPPTTERIRLTISVTPEVHATFQRMAEVSGMSIGRCMGEWLADTSEGAVMITRQLEKARQAPRLAVAEMRQWALGAVDQADELLADLRSGRKVKPEPTEGSPLGGEAPAAQAPRPVIRGGKSPGETRNKGAGSRSSRGGKA